MKKFLMKKACISAMYVVGALLVEMITFLVMGFGVFPQYWGLDVAFIIGIGVLLFMLPTNKGSIATAGIILTLQMVLGVINEALNVMSGLVFSLNMLNLAKEVGGVFTSDFVNWWMLVGLILVVASTVFFMVFFNLRLPTQKIRINKQMVIVLLLCCLIGENACLMTYQTTMNTFTSAVVSDELSLYDDDEYLYESQFIPAKAFKKFGTYAFYFMNITNTLESLLTGFEGGVSASKQREFSTLDEYFQNGVMSEDAYDANSIYTGAVAGKNIVLIVIESGEWYAINKEYTPTLYSMAADGIAFSEYYARDKTNHSEAMSILGSYPVQSDPSTKLVNSTLAFTLPNLLRATGYTTSYFHTNFGDFYNRTITHGDNGLYGFDKGNFPENLPGLRGYTDHDKNFYDFDHDRLITQLHYDRFTHQNDDDRAFFTMQMTLTSHGHYHDLVDYGDYNGPEDAAKAHDYVVKGFEKYYEVIDGYPQTFVAGKAIDFDHLATLSKSQQEIVYLRYKRYQAGMMDLDEEINVLVNKLQQDGELDDTMFFFYSDHTAYYNQQNFYLKGVNLDDQLNSLLYNIPCFLWYGGSMDGNFAPVGEFYDGYQPLTFTATKDKSSVLQKGTVDKFCNSFDIVPTILQLVGYDYNLNLYHGVSMFSDLESVFVSRESGIFRNDVYFDGSTVAYKNGDEWILLDYEAARANATLPQNVQDFLKQSVAYYEKQEKLELMYKIDYFAQRNIASTSGPAIYVRQVKTSGNV